MTLSTKSVLTVPVAGGRVVSALDYNAGGLPFKSGILPLLKLHVGNSNQPAKLAIKRSAGFAPEVNLGECTSFIPLPSVNKAAYSGFETQRILTRSPKQIYVSTNMYLQKSSDLLHVLPAGNWLLLVCCWKVLNAISKCLKKKSLRYDHSPVLNTKKNCGVLF